MNKKLFGIGLLLFIVLISSSFNYVEATTKTINAQNSNVTGGIAGTPFVGTMFADNFTGLSPGQYVSNLAIKINATNTGTFTQTANFAGTHGTSNFGKSLTGNVWAYRYTIPAGATVDKIYLNVFAAAGNVRVKVYNETGGVISSLIAESSGAAVSGTGIQGFPITATVPSNGIIWAAFEGDSGSLDLYYDAGAGECVHTHTYGTGPDPFGACTGWDPWWSRVEYVIPDAHVRVKIYNDTSGSPSNLLGQSGSVTLSGTGIQGFPVNAVIPTGGKIWAVFETDSNAPAISHNSTGTNAFKIAHTYGTGPDPFGIGTAWKSFWARLTWAPLLTSNSTNGNVNKNILLSGAGYHNGSAILIYYDNVRQLTNPGLPTSNTTGGFSNVIITIPESVAGQHIVNASDTYGNSNTLTYNVTSSLYIVPTSGNVGQNVIGNIKGFSGGATVTIKFDGATVQTITTNSIGTGTSSVSFHIPSALSGSHTISATDGSHTATQTFTIPAGSGSGSASPSLSLSPTSGIAGSTVTATGNGFNKTATIKFYFNNTLIGTSPGTVTTNSTGSFSGVTFLVPSLGVGTYTVKANDTLGNYGTALYQITSLTPGSVSPVTDLTATTLNTTAIRLTWTQPDLGGNTLKGYEINYTTPYGNPETILIDNTNSSATIATVTSLQANTQYSFRIGVIAGLFFNPNGNIANATTTNDFTPQNFTIGRDQGTILNATNTLSVPMYFIRNDISGTNNTNLNLIYPNSYNPSCNMFYEFAQINKTYSNLSNIPFDGSNKETTFTFNNFNNEIVEITCTDAGTGDVAKYVLTQPIIGGGKFPFLQQIDNFKNGTYGTHGQFGAIDFITLVAVLLSMIGLNRASETVGGIFSIIIIGVLSFFGIISILSTILSVVALVVLLLVTTTRKQ